MEPPGPGRHGGRVSHHALRSPSQFSSTASMANAPMLLRASSATPFGSATSPPYQASNVSAKRVDEPQGDAIVRQLVAQLSESMNASLRAVAEQFGVGDVAAESPAVPEDARVVVQELQKARRKERELQLLVEDLQTEQRVAKERLALYSILALKLKRELINEKLAHIDTKKEMEEMRVQYEREGSVGEPRSPDNMERARGACREGNTQRASQTQQDDPWTSPNKPTGDAAAGAAGVPLSFGSFYSSRQPTSQDGADDEDDSVDEDDEQSSQQLRNSLMGQFLPSSLLDSPQLTPTSRTTGAARLIDNQTDDNEDTAPSQEDTQNEEAEKSHFGEADDAVRVEQELSSFVLSPSRESDSSKASRCDGCGLSRAQVVEIVDCGHRLCRPCEHELDRVEVSSPTKDATAAKQCPRCEKAVLSLAYLDGKGIEDNQLEHLRQIGASRPSSSDSTATAVSTSISAAVSTAALGTSGPSVAVAPLTLSLLNEMFESISIEEMEGFLKEAGGQVSGAIERILQRHPSFNPALAAEVSVSAAPGAGSGPKVPGALHRSGSVSGGNQQSSQPASNAPGGSNWKTEMCMYYLQGKCNKTRRTCSFAHGESDLVRTTTVKHTSSTSYKSRMCPLWLEGSCPKSRRECPLAHGENDLRDGLALLSQNAGGAGGAGGASGGAGPIVPPTLPTTAPRLQNYKTELCYYYLKGCCNFTKEECRFAHGESDLRTVESNTLEWSAQLAGASAAAAVKSGFMDPYGNTNPSASTSDKSSMLQQHQYQQQYLGQYQSAPQQQSPAQQPPISQHPTFGLTPQAPQFVPQSHQYHQMQPQAMHPHLPGHPGSQQSPYGVAGPSGMPHQSPYRYMKSMEEIKPPRRPPPPRRETWSQQSYDAIGSDF